MKKFNEWKNEESDSSKLFKNIKKLSNNLKLNLESFQGEKFSGFNALVENVNNIQSILHEAVKKSKKKTPRKKVCCTEPNCDCVKFVGKSTVCNSCDHKKSKHKESKD